MDIERLKQDLLRDEGCVEHAYTDSEGYLTIGIGHLIDGRLGGRLSDNVIDTIFREDVNRTGWDLDHSLPWWRSLDDSRQNALANMAFNLGVPRLLLFKKFLAALQAGDWETAAQEMLSSLWARQVGARAERLAAVIRGGV